MKTGRKVYKIIPIMFILFLIQSTNSGAQDKLRMGPVAGFGIRTITGIDFAGPGLGYCLGISSVIPLKSRMTLVPEIIYSEKGYRYKKVDGAFFMKTTASDEKLNLNYVNLLVPFRYSIKGSFGIVGGIQAGYLIDAKYSFTKKSKGDFFAENFSFEETGSGHVTGELKRFDGGLVLGSSFLFKDGFSMGALADIGLLDIDGDTDIGKNVTFNIRFAYLLASPGK